MSDMTEKIEVQNCKAEMSFNEEIKHPLFPVRGSGIVLLAYCGKCTESDGDARLVTNSERVLLFCRAIYCENHESEQA